MASLWTLPQGDGIWSLAVTLGTLKIISEGFSYFENFNFYFIYKELVLFPPKVAVLDEPSEEVRLVQFNEADVLRILVETLAAHIEAVFPDETVPV